jgi:hypothetical protein
MHLSEHTNEALHSMNVGNFYVAGAFVSESHSTMQ